MNAAGSAEHVDEIAVVGLACRFPGAPSADAFWANIAGGVESITFYTREELEAAGVDPALLRHPHYVRSGGGVLEDVDLFDAEFFGLEPDEAALVDPQQRLFLECAHESLENAGYDPTTYSGAIGVFAGVGGPHYLLHNIAANQAVRERAGGLGLSLTNEKDFLTLRVSYLLNLRGPSIDVQTACSTSLVATHLACQSLSYGECDIALAGGASIHTVVKQGYLYEEGGIFAADGHCRAFDASASGMIGGDGVGVVVLKRLEDALEDGDTIRAVIKGSAINNDGSAKVGFLAPGVDSQRQVVSEAMDLANVDPRTVSYVEAHGTGTPLGDMIEIAALTDAFREHTDDRGFCAVGSVKTNIGHANTAAGAAALIKTILALEHHTLPPSLNFDEPNPEIDFESSPFFVNTKRRTWAANGPRRACVHALAIGGTNAHLVLEEAPAPELTTDGAEQLIVLSARTESALDQATANLVAHLEQHDDLSLADVAFTLQAGRRALPHRRTLVAKTLDDAREALAAASSDRVATRLQERTDTPVVFLLPDGGADLAGAAAHHYESYSVFRERLDACAAALQSHTGIDVRDVLVRAQGGDSTRDAAAFALGYALAGLWMHWGVQPEANIGRGVGVRLAACLSGSLELEDAARGIAADTPRDTTPEPLDAELSALLAGKRRLFVELGAEPQLGAEVLQLDPTADVIPGGGPTMTDLLAALGRTWLAGVPVEWESLHDDATPRRIPLPTYPFERQRHWVEVTTAAAPLQVQPADHWCYHPSWRRLGPLEAGPAPALEGTTWLLLADGVGLSAELAPRLRAGGARVIELHPGEAFGRAGDDNFEVRADHAEDYRATLDALEADDALPDRVVHLWSVTTPDASAIDLAGLDDTQSRGFYSALFLAQALGARGTNTRITIVTNELFEVIGGEATHPERATVLGPCAAIGREYDALTSHHIDVQLGSAPAADLAHVADLLQAACAEVPEHDTIAFRASYRWAPTYEPAVLPAIDTARFRDRGVYLITGGLGGIGMAIAEYLASACHARLVLLTRSGDPAQVAQRLEQLGSEVLVATADVADAPQVRSAVAQAVERFGQIHGVIHAAGVPPAGDIATLDAETAGAVLAPKVRGTLTLREELRAQPLDFFVACSSLSAVLGGGADDAAASAFLDALAQCEGDATGTPFSTIDWDTWAEVGWAAQADVPDALRDLHRAALARGIRTSDGVKTFARLAARPWRRVAISTSDLPARLDRGADADALLASEVTETRRERPNLSTPYAPPESPTEVAIAALWEEVLGFSGIGIHDNFFEVGGRSLTGTRVISRLRSELHVELPVRQLFESPTIADLAKFIEVSRWVTDEGAGDSGLESGEREEIEL